MSVYQNVLEMIGNTPMLLLRDFDTGPCELYLKLELANPGGSIKDRIAVSMIAAAEGRGEDSVAAASGDRPVRRKSANLGPR